MKTCYSARNNPYTTGFFHNSWVERIEKLVEGIDPHAEDTYSNPNFLEAMFLTGKLAKDFEATHHLFRQNIHASEETLDVYRFLGGNVVYLTNPCVTVQYYDEALEEEGDLAIELDNEIRVRYTGIELCYTPTDMDGESYFGPHLIAELKITKDLQHENFIMPAGPYQIQVPFPGVMVPKHQPHYQLN